MIFIVVKWKPKAEYVENFTDEVAEFTQATRSEPGNLFFEWSRGVDDPSEYVLVEGFRDGRQGTSPAGTSRSSSAEPRRCCHRPHASSVMRSTPTGGAEWAR